MNEASQLISTLRVVRRKLQRERLLKGFALLLTSFVAASILSSYLLSQENFSAQALLWTRLFGGAGLLFLFLRYLLEPGLRPPSSRRVARFLEERYPALQDRLSTAVEVIPSSRIHGGMGELIERDAWKELQDLSQPRLYRPQAALFWSLTLLVSLLIFGSLFFTGPQAYRYSLGRVLWGWSDRHPPPLYVIKVIPGSTKVTRHADVEIRATLVGFDSQQVGLLAHYEDAPGWERVRMQPGETGNQFVFLFFDVRERMDYYVEAEGIRSDTYSILVSDAPRVEKLEIVLRFPEYTGLEEVVLEERGDILALAGTTAELRIQADQTVRDGKITLERGGDIPLQAIGSRELQGELEIRENDSYLIYFQDQEQFWNPGSAKYLVEVLPDHSPVVSLTRPGRDLKVTNIEEVFAQVEVEDDYGIEALALFFSVNGGPEQRVKLGDPRGSPSFSTSHTFYLEEFNLQPGDFVSYFVEASDARSSSATDIYFLEVQPYERQYYQSQQGGVPAESRSLILSRRQKEIIAATFRLDREKHAFSTSEFEQHSRTLALVQQRLQAEAKAIAARIERRAVVGRLGKMAEYLRQAIRYMNAAQHELSRLRPKEALPEERQSFRQLLQAEALFQEVQIAFSTDQAGAAEELADLVDLELDKTKNQYETLHQAQARSRDRELARLSRRQEDPVADLSQELRRAARDMRQAQSGYGNSQEAQMRARQAGERLRWTESALRQYRRQQLAQRLEELEADSERMVQEQGKVVRKVDQLREQQQSGGVGQDFMRELRGLLNEKAALQEQLQRLKTDLHRSAQSAFGEPEVSRKLERGGRSLERTRLWPDFPV